MIEKVLTLTAFFAMAVHPFIHGTPLDGGVLDPLIVWLQSRVAR
jgi:hypothetical protein